MSETLETEKLLLLRVTPDDAENYHALVNDPTVKSFSTSNRPAASVEDYRRWFGNPKHKTKDIFKVVSKDSGCFIGICGFCQNEFLQELFPDVDLVEITIQLLEPHRRCGFGTQLVKCLERHAFEKQRRQLVIGIPNPENQKSIAFLSAIQMPQWLCINDKGEHGYYRSTVYAQNQELLAPQLSQ